MKKLYSILIFLFSFYYFFAFDDIEQPYSLLLGNVRRKIFYKAMGDIPYKRNLNLLQMGKAMEKAKYSFSLNDAESAFLVYDWVISNIKVDFQDNDKYIETVYHTGKGNPDGVSSLFIFLCNFLKIKSKPISGLIKIGNVSKIENFISYKKSTWNYIVINNTYYLIDATLGSGVFNDRDYSYYYGHVNFATKPEIFINSHFPYDSKWQLLPQPFTIKKFTSRPFVSDCFYEFGYESFSPDNIEINGSGEIKLALTYTELNFCDDIYASTINVYSNLSYKYEVDTKINELKGKKEIILNKNNKKPLILKIGCVHKARSVGPTHLLMAYKLNPD